MAYDGIDTGQNDEDDEEDNGDPGGDDEDDGEELPDYPVWSPEVAYYDYGTYVLHLGRVFWARQYVSKNVEPGLITSPWQEITNEYRNFNVYDTGALYFFRLAINKIKKNTAFGRKVMAWKRCNIFRTNHSDCLR